MSDEANKEQKDDDHEDAYLKAAESKVFSAAMRVAENYASSKKKVYRVLQFAFEKLKEESARNRLKVDFIEHVSILGRMVKAYFSGKYKKVPTSTILRILGGLIYFIWILDLVPDFIPVLGLADDIAVIFWVYNGIKEELEDFENWEAANTLRIK